MKPMEILSKSEAAAVGMMKLHGGLQEPITTMNPKPDETIIEIGL